MGAKFFHCEQTSPDPYSCRRCSFKTSALILLRTHMIDSHPRNGNKSVGLHQNPLRKLICLGCSFKTHSLFQGLKHEIECLSDLGEFYECALCTYITKRKQDLKNHHSCEHVDDTKIKWIKCGYCRYKTKFRHNLQIHLKKHIKCNRRPLKTNNLRLFHQHSQIRRTIIQSFCCEKCKFRSKYKNSLKHHYFFKHVETSDIFDCEKTELTPYLCPKCPFQSDVLMLLDVHTKLEEISIKSYICDGCSWESHSQLQSLVHKNQCRNEIKTIQNNVKLERRDSDVKWFQCDHCAYKTKHKNDLQIHLNLHHNKENLFYCAHCDYKTEVKKNLPPHIKRRHPNETNDPWLKCSKCDYTTKLGEDLNRHVKDVHLDATKWFKCDRCSYKAKRKTSMQLHLLKHSDNKQDGNAKFKCEHCYFRTTQQRYLIGHVNTVHLDESKAPWIHCEQCNYKTKSRGALDSHFRYKHPDKFFVCDKCSYSTKFEGKLRKHKVVKHKDVTLECHQCDYKTLIEEELTSHTKQHNHAMFKCEHCQFGTTQKRYLISHVNTVHPNESQAPWIQCDLCDYRTKSRDSLKKHTKCKHADKYLVCDKCPFRTKIEGELRKHKVVKHEDVTPIRWLHCDQCDYKTQIEDRLISHKKQKHNNAMFKCEHCQFGTTQKRYLISHVNTVHPNESKAPWIQCDLCNYTTKSRDAIAKHVKYKHADRRFVCDKCAFSTTYEANLKKHKIVKHKEVTPMRWLECDQCDFKTNSEKKMARHKSSHLTEWLKCRYCEFKTTLESQLASHRCVHSGMFPCDYCHFEGVTNNELVVHMNESHGGATIPEQHLMKDTVVPVKDGNATKKPKMTDQSVENRPKTPPQNKECAVGEPELDCDECSFTTKYRVALETHKRFKHNETDQSVLVVENRLRMILPRPKTPRQNKKSAVDGSELECDKCSFTTEYKVALETHKRFKHNGVV